MKERGGGGREKGNLKQARGPTSFLFVLFCFESMTFIWVTYRNVAKDLLTRTETTQRQLHH